MKLIDRYGTQYIKINGSLEYKIEPLCEYKDIINSPDDFVIKKQLFSASYHTHRFGRPLKTKTQRPRWKSIGIYKNTSECLEEIRAHLTPIVADAEKTRR